MKDIQLYRFRKRSHYAVQCVQVCYQMGFDIDLERLRQEYGARAKMLTTSVAQAVIEVGETAREINVFVPVSSGSNIGESVQKVKAILEDIEAEVLRVLRDEEWRTVAQTSEQEERES